MRRNAPRQQGTGQNDLFCPVRGPHLSWAKALDYLRPGDTLVVPSLDRLARPLQDLITIVADLRRRSVGFRSPKESLDTTTPGGRLVFHVFAALAGVHPRAHHRGHQRGLTAAKARGVRLRRSPAMTPEQVRHARALLTPPDATVSSIARLLGVSRSTLYKYSHGPGVVGAATHLDSAGPASRSDGEGGGVSGADSDHGL